MLHILIFSIGIMYTPGPVNLLSFNNGLQKDMTAQIRFSVGVAGALFIWFMLVGYAGSSIVNEAMLPYIGGLGSAFILYLAAKVMFASVDTGAVTQSAMHLTFKDGLFMQLLNPKSFLVVFPVATVQFPAAGIVGPYIALWSALLGLLGFGAPTLYAVLGTVVGQRINRPIYFRLFNTVMGVLLAYVACDIAYTHTYLPLMS